MAGFQTMTFQKHDDYMTPKSAWEAIKEYIPDNKILWDPFYGDGASGTYLQEIKPNNVVIHEDNQDFFELIKDFQSHFQYLDDYSDYSGLDIHGDTCIITNPPFSKCKEILNAIHKAKAPFIMIMPSSKICTQYFRKLFENDDDPIQIIIPRKRIHFKKLLWDEETEEWKEPENWKNCCNFDCFYYCWKMNLPRDIIWLK